MGKSKQKQDLQKKNNKKRSSQRIPRGRTLTTNDKYLAGSKTNSTKNRPLVVVDTNGKNLAVVTLSATDGKNRTELKGYKNPKTGKKTYYKHFLEIQDNEGKPIQVNDKFRENHKNMDVSYKNVIKIRKTLFYSSKPMQQNREKLDKFKNKKNDWD